MARFIFHENFDHRVVLGMVFLVAGAATPGWSGTPLAGPSAFSELDNSEALHHPSIIHSSAYHLASARNGRGIG
jgi:hypothetical protein